jgi:hypothetical protein
MRACVCLLLALDILLNQACLCASRIRWKELNALTAVVSVHVCIVHAHRGPGTVHVCLSVMVQMSSGQVVASQEVAWQV